MLFGDTPQFANMNPIVFFISNSNCCGWLVFFISNPNRELGRLRIVGFLWV